MSQDTNERVPTLSKAFLLPLIPFCLLGFLNSLFIVCGAQILKRGMYRGSLVSFLGRTEKQRTMAFDMTRVFCYSVLQLVFQVSILFKSIQKCDDIIENLISLYSAGADVGLHSMEKRSLLSVTLHRGIRVCSNFSKVNLFSMQVSFLVVIKICAELLTFNNIEEEEQPTTCCQKMKKALKEKVQLVKTFCSLFPFLFTSGVFNIGTISLAIVVLNFDAFYFLGIAFVINLAIFLMVPCLLKIRCVRKYWNQDEVFSDEEDVEDPFLTSILLSWTNLFILSCSLEKTKVQMTASLFLVQLARVPTNVILLLYLFSVHGLDSEFPLVAIISWFLIFVGGVFLVLIWKSSLLRKRTKGRNAAARNQFESELRERVETQKGQIQEDTQGSSSNQIETNTQENRSQIEED